ncbi:MAG: DUF167 family protein [Candidatus Bathyarchaeota archaeon]|jgi:hypothetical protein|nr:DUF167 family protein [Candidatus Bathyarchaeota archaeon]
MRINEVKDGVILDVNVKPNSKEFKIVVEGDEIVVFCVEAPVKGKVNKELVKEFSRLFHSKVELVSGFTSKQKKLLIRGFRKSEVERILLRK